MSERKTQNRLLITMFLLFFRQAEEILVNYYSLSEHVSKYREMQFVKWLC